LRANASLGDFHGLCIQCLISGCLELGTAYGCQISLGSGHFHKTYTQGLGGKSIQPKFRGANHAGDPSDHSLLNKPTVIASGPVVTLPSFLAQQAHSDS
jgi:hypothetical protein